MALLSAGDYRDFYETLTLENIEARVISDQQSIAQALVNPNNIDFLNHVSDRLIDKLRNIEQGSGVKLYRITNSSNPEIFIQFIDASNKTLLSTPAFPLNVAEGLKDPQLLSSEAKGALWIEEKKSAWLDLIITDQANHVVGRVRILYIAQFDPWVQLQTILDFLLNASLPLFLFAVPIGIICGKVASKYVTSQLQKMNVVTESWRQGDFTQRIALPSDDVLILHSKHLNGMAQDLEMFMSLKENLAVSDERNRVARELHDTVKQKLFALGLQLATSKNNPKAMKAVGDHLIEAEIITREAQQDLMEIITQLRPAGDGENSILDRINMIAADFRRRFGVYIELNSSKPIRCNAHTEHQVLRITHEALMNAVRHGEASRIIIEGNVSQGIFNLTITDNGCGFNVKKKADGFGLFSMQDRASDLPQGALNVNSKIGQGTEVKLTWKAEE